jgi:hypothetical protein
MTKGKLYSEVYNKSTRMQDKSHECYDAVEIDAVNDLLSEAQAEFPFKFEGEDMLEKDVDYKRYAVNPNEKLKAWILKWFGDE